MHDHSLRNMERFYDRFLAPHIPEIHSPVRVLDVGSMDINGSYRALYSDPAFDYVGLDLEAGPGVDIVTRSPYAYPLPDNSADIVLCGQMLEHCEFFWDAFKEMLRVAKPGAFIVLIVPSKGFVHRFPVDCYRFLPDALPALARYSGCRLLTSWQDESSEWGDLVGVFVKAPAQAPEPSKSPVGYVHQGLDYRDFLAREITAIESRAHLEIGTRQGSSIAGLNCPTIAIDPDLQLGSDVIGGKAQCLFFQMTSDDFFEQFKPRTLLQRALDTAFLDGMHRFEYLLRDFINTERSCHSDSTIYLHDCLPVTTVMTNRDERKVATTGPFAHWWAGDVWKILPVLKRYRPELEITCFDCPPTGIVRIRGLRPRSQRLSANYEAIVDEYGPQELSEETLEQLLRESRIQASR